MTKVLQADNNLMDKIAIYYKNYLKDNNNPYIKYFIQTNDFSISIYTSGKVVFQGKDVEEEFSKWSTTTNPSLKKVELDLIGSDEVGTGDLFGPIVVVASFVDEKTYKYLESLNIKDSKKLTDEYMLQIGPLLKDHVTHELAILDNIGYNEMIDRGYNMNKIKALMHNDCIYRLSNKVNAKGKVIDQFTTIRSYYSYLENEKNVVRDIHFETKAEDKYISVATASILARYYFLILFARLKRDSGYPLIKGASSKTIDIAQVIKNEKGMDYLLSITKKNFKSLNELK